MKLKEACLKAIEGEENGYDDLYHPKHKEWSDLIMQITRAINAYNKTFGRYPPVPLPKTLRRSDYVDTEKVTSSQKELFDYF